MLGREMRRVIIASLVVAASLAVPAASATVAGGGWSKPAVLTRTGVLTYLPSVAISPNGTTVIVWTEYDNSKNTYAVMAAIRTAKGKVSKHDLGPATNAFSKAGLAVGGDGTFAVAWDYPGGGLAVRVMGPGSKAFGATSKVATADVSVDYGAGDVPGVAVDDAGTVYVTWEANTSNHYQVLAAQRAKGARAWSSAQHLSASGADAHGARIAADGNGKVAVTWGGTDSSVWATEKSSAKGSFRAAQQIAGKTYESTPSLVSISDAGKTALLWEQSAGASHRIASKIGTSGFPAQPQLISGSGIARYPALAIASSGTGAAAWEEEVAGGWQIDAASLAAGAKSWSKPGKLIATGFAATFGVAPVAAANDKRAVVAWSQKDLHHHSFVGIGVRVGSRWSKTSFPGLSAPSVAVTNDPGKSERVGAAVVWLSTKGLQISILK